MLGRPERKKIIARERGYHGSGLMTGSLTGPAAVPQGVRSAAAAGPPHALPALLEVRPARRELDFTRRCAAELERLIPAETVGLIPAPAGYWVEIQQVLNKYDVLLIADEVVTGFGRLGTWFGSDYYGMRPDLITIAKGLTSAYVPLSG